MADYSNSQWVGDVVTLFEGDDCEDSSFRQTRILGDLTGVNFDFCEFHRCVFEGDLRLADLSRIKAEFFDKLSRFPVHELQFTVNEIELGRIDGARYININSKESDCQCIFGSILKSRNAAFSWDKDTYAHKIPEVELDVESLVEKFVYGVKPEETPTTNPILSIVREWLLEIIHAKEA